MHTAASPQSYLSPNVNSAKAEKPFSRLSFKFPRSISSPISCGVAYCGFRANPEVTLGNPPPFFCKKITLAIVGSLDFHVRHGLSAAAKAAVNFIELPRLSRCVGGIGTWRSLTRGHGLCSFQLASLEATCCSCLFHGFCPIKKPRVNG